jgi:hypothetical protein
MRRLLALLALAPLLLGAGGGQGFSGKKWFSIALVGDTGGATLGNEERTIDTILDWVVANRVEQRIVGVFHSGDIMNASAGRRIAMQAFQALPDDLNWAFVPAHWEAEETILCFESGDAKYFESDELYADLAATSGEWYGGPWFVANPAAETDAGLCRWTQDIWWTVFRLYHGASAFNVVNIPWDGEQPAAIAATVTALDASPGATMLSSHCLMGHAGQASGPDPFNRDDNMGSCIGDPGYGSMQFAWEDAGNRHVALLNSGHCPTYADAVTDVNPDGNLIVGLVQDYHTHHAVGDFGDFVLARIDPCADSITLYQIDAENNGPSERGDGGPCAYSPPFGTPIEHCNAEVWGPYSPAGLKARGMCP